MYNNVINVHFATLDCPCSPECINRMHYHTLINSITGNRTKQQVSMTYKQVVRSLIKDKFLPNNTYDDIFEDSVKIKYKPIEKRALTKVEKIATFTATLTPFDRTFLYLLYGLGLRRGEALALEKGDIDIKNKTTTISKALGYVGNNPYKRSTKTENEIRIIPIPDIIISTLEDYISNLKVTLLFPSRSGGYFSRSSYRKMWERILKQMQKVSTEEIVGLTAHIYRHNYCANLCYHVPAISIKQIAALLGDTEKMVLEVYNHIISERENPLEVVESALDLEPPSKTAKSEPKQPTVPSSRIA